MEEYEWAPNLGVSLLLGVDGLSSPLVLLTGIICPLTVLFSWREGKTGSILRSPSCNANCPLWSVHNARLLCFLYLLGSSFDSYVLPYCNLGRRQQKIRVISSSFVTFTASVIMLVGFMALYFEAGVNSFS